MLPCYLTLRGALFPVVTSDMSTNPILDRRRIGSHIRDTPDGLGRQRTRVHGLQWNNNVCSSSIRRLSVSTVHRGSKREIRYLDRGCTVRYRSCLSAGVTPCAGFAQCSARFGPTGIRLGSRPLSKWFNTDIETGFNASNDWAKIVDCGDVHPPVRSQLIQAGYGYPI